MSRSEECFRAGDLAGSLDALQAEVRQRPEDAKPRVFLAQLLMVMGQWDRALIQLSTIAELDPSAIPMAHAYRSAIQCEVLRSDVFAGTRSPVLFGDPEPWTASMLQALKLDAKGSAEEAASLRAAALEAAPMTAGAIDDRRFEWLADADSRLGPILEVLLNGAYYWVPAHHVRQIEIESPADARDLVWIPATFTWTNGGDALGFIPVRYPGSEKSGDNGIRMARRTEWQETGAGGIVGLGQRMLTTDADDFPLLGVRRISFDEAS